MVYRPLRIKVLALFLSLSTIIVTAPFSFAETVAATPLGTVVTKGSVTIGKSAAPTGTTVFAGDQVTSNQPALINLSSGSRVEMTGAAATFAREGNTLVVKANQGLVRFNFKEGEDVRIDAGSYRFTGGNNSSRIGELGLNPKGEIVMNLAKGSFAALNTATGVRTEVLPSSPLMVVSAATKAAAQQSAAETGAAKGSGGSAAATAALVVAGVASAVGLGIGIHEAVKSSSSR